MSNKANNFLKKALGDDFFESLQKFEIWKPGTKTVIDHEEIKTALHIVPRTMMAILIRELSPMAIDETKEVSIPLSEAAAIMRATKHERDVYSGEIFQDNKKVTEFKFRSLPGVGLIIMSAFELYEVSELSKEQLLERPDPSSDMENKIQKLIEERIALHDLINKVVDKKLLQKEAVQTLVLSKLSHVMSQEHSDPEPVAKKESEIPNKKKGSPLKSFLESKKKKNEFSIQMAKGETVNCPDCNKNIFDGKLFSGCICLGDDMERKVFIKKTEEGIKVRFSKGWDQENIEMLLEVLRRKNG